MPPDLRSGGCCGLTKVGALNGYYKKSSWSLAGGLLLSLCLLAVPVVVLAAQSGPTGFLEICKEASTAAVTGDFDFTAGGHAVTVPVGACSAAIEMAAGPVTVVEAPVEGIAVSDIETAPAGRLLDKDLVGRTAHATVVAGDVSVQTTITFTNHADVAPLKICKVAGAGVVVGASFDFKAGTVPVSVPAGPPPGGYCVVAGSFPVASKVAVSEVVPRGLEVSSITVAPANRLVGAANPGGATVVARIGPGVTEATFTNQGTSVAVPSTTVVPSTSTVPPQAISSTTLVPPSSTTTTPLSGVVPISLPPTSTTTTAVPPTTTPPVAIPSTTTTVPGSGPTPPTPLPSVTTPPSSTTTTLPPSGATPPTTASPIPVTTTTAAPPSSAVPPSSPSPTTSSPPSSNSPPAGVAPSPLGVTGAVGSLPRTGGFNRSVFWAGLGLIALGGVLLALQRGREAGQMGGDDPFPALTFQPRVRSEGGALAALAAWGPTRTGTARFSTGPDIESRLGQRSGEPGPVIHADRHPLLQRAAHT